VGVGVILFAASRRLNYLIMGAGALVYKTVAEYDSSVIDNLGHLKRLQITITAVRRDEFGRFLHVSHFELLLIS
jgi:hypothetical protein